jgi:hypothetical protein
LVVDIDTHQIVVVREVGIKCVGGHISLVVLAEIICEAHHKLISEVCEAGMVPRSSD